MKNYTLFLLIMFSIFAYTQDNFKLYYEDTKDGFVILADNDEYSPVSAKIDFKLENLKPTSEDKTIFVVPANTKRHIITELNVVDRKKRIRLGFESIYNHGNHHLKKYDRDFDYYLPFGKGAAYLLSQGYNGATSHKGENALDFKMPIGT